MDLDCLLVEDPVAPPPPKVARIEISVPEIRNLDSATSSSLLAASAKKTTGTPSTTAASASSQDSIKTTEQCEDDDSAEVAQKRVDVSDPMWDESTIEILPDLPTAFPKPEVAQRCAPNFDGRTVDTLPDLPTTFPEPDSNDLENARFLEDSQIPEAAIPISTSSRGSSCGSDVVRPRCILPMQPDME